MARTRLSGGLSLGLPSTLTDGRVAAHHSSSQLSPHGPVGHDRNLGHFLPARVTGFDADDDAREHALIARQTSACAPQGARRLSPVAQPRRAVVPMIAALRYTVGLLPLTQNCLLKSAPDL
jgi:hypothetical protein